MRWSVRDWLRWKKSGFFSIAMVQRNRSRAHSDHTLASCAKRHSLRLCDPLRPFGPLRPFARMIDSEVSVTFRERTQRTEKTQRTIKTPAHSHQCLHSTPRDFLGCRQTTFQHTHLIPDL